MGFKQKEPRISGRMSLHVKTTLEANRLPAEATGALLFLVLSLVCRASLYRGAAGQQRGALGFVHRARTGVNMSAKAKGPKKNLGKLIIKIASCNCIRNIKERKKTGTDSKLNQLKYLWQVNSYSYGKFQ